MSGHSKWANIKHKKEATDKIRGAVFSKLSKIITIAVIEGGGVTDPENNLRLRMAIEKARFYNMPNSNIERAIEKGIGPDRALLKEVIYEGFAPYGVALIMLGTTDNSNRTLSELKSVLERHGGKLAQQGAVAYLFKKCAVIHFEKDTNPEERVFKFAEKIQADDIDEDNAQYILYFPLLFLNKVNDNLDQLPPRGTIEVIYKATSSIKLTDEQKTTTIKLIKTLEALDDIHQVFSNYV